jgi:glycolate oxidase FAD binding subunit
LTTATPGHAPTSTAEIAEVLRDARTASRALRFVGAGRWSGDGTPAAAIRSEATPVSLRGLAGIVAYVPNDLTLTARAGTTLAELNAATAAHNQWCPLLPWGDDEGTLGATFATASTGPFGATLGRPRDLALGIEFVDGEGTVARGGGRVVKNVAGFDLTRLMVGAFGTLGVLTEVTVRLRARPAVDVTLCVAPRDGTAAGAAALADALRRAEIPALGCETLDARSSGSLALPSNTVLVRYAGNAALVQAGRDIARKLGNPSDADPAAWTALRALDRTPRRVTADPFATVVARRLKERFDPAGILNPGVFGEAAR